jgi:hypothetical protein
MPAPSIECVVGRHLAKVADVKNYLERITGARKVVDTAKDMLHDYMRVALQMPNSVRILSVNGSQSEYAQQYQIIVVVDVPGQVEDIRLEGTGRSDQEVFDMLRAKLHMLL